jgi:hypothetical protein
VPVRNVYYEWDITCLIERSYIFLAVYRFFPSIVSCAIMAVACLCIKAFGFEQCLDRFVFDNFNAMAFFKQVKYRKYARNCGYAKIALKVFLTILLLILIECRADDFGAECISAVRIQRLSII